MVDLKVVKSYILNIEWLICESKIDEIAIKKVKLLKNEVRISLILQTIYYLCEQNITL